jgi:hypothetical protein
MGRAEAMARAHRLAAAGQLFLTRSVQVDLEGLDYDVDDVADCIRSCCVADIEKEMDDQYREGALVLVFDRIQYGEDELYLKFSVPPNDDGNVVVLSFKLSGSPR